MEYRLGNSKKIKEQGETVEITCPNCNKKVNFSVFSNDASRLIPKFPVVKKEVVFFLVCPECSSVFGIDESKGKTFKDDRLAVGNYDLKELEKFEV